jgi:hypothetical protein
MKQELLNEIAETLHENSLNYSVSLGIFTSQHKKSLTNEDIICKALNSNVSFYEMHSVEKQEILHTVMSSLMYAGDEGSGPSKENINSHKFKSLLRDLTISLTKIISSSTENYSFCIKDGHPYYPVFWDFSFLFVRNNFSLVFIGTSSD